MFDKNFTTETFLDFRRDRSEKSSLREVQWRDDRSAYFGSEGMCGGHNDVGLRISVDGIPPIEKVIDLPLGWTSFSVLLGKNAKGALSEVTQLSHIFGNVFEKGNSPLESVDVKLIDQNGNIFHPRLSSEGQFAMDVVPQNYILMVSGTGYRPLRVINFSVKGGDQPYLNLELKRTLSPGNMSNSPDTDDGASEIVLDYQTIKKGIDN